MTNEEIEKEIAVRVSAGIPKEMAREVVEAQIAHDVALKKQADTDVEAVQSKKGGK